MTDTLAPRAQRREVTAEDSHLVRDHYDYADAFEIHISEGETRTPEQMFRAALKNGPSVLSLVPVVHRQVLRLRLGPLASPDHIIGWRVVSSDAEVIHLEASGPLIRAVIVGRRARRRLRCSQRLSSTSGVPLPGSSGHSLARCIAGLHRTYWS